MIIPIRLEIVASNRIDETAFMIFPYEVRSIGAPTALEHRCTSTYRSAVLQCVNSPPRKTLFLPVALPLPVQQQTTQGLGVVVG